MIERRIFQLKVQTRKQRDRWTHARTHARSVVSTHDIVERRSNLVSLCRRTNNTIIFISFVYRKLWTVLLVWASMLWLDWEDIWVSKTFFLVQLVSFFNNTLLCEKKKKAEMIIESLYQRGDPSCRCFKDHSRVSTLRCPTRKAFFFLLLFFFSFFSIFF